MRVISNLLKHYLISRYFSSKSIMCSSNLNKSSAKSCDHLSDSDNDSVAGTKIKVFAKIFVCCKSVMQFEAEFDEDDATIDNLSTYSRDLMHFEGYTMYGLHKIYDSTDKRDFGQDDENESLEDGHRYEIRLYSMPDDDEMSTQISVQINDEEPMDLVVETGATIADIVKDNFDHIKSIGRVHKWSETFDAWCYEKRCYRVNLSDYRFKVEGVVTDEDSEDEDEDSVESNESGKSTSKLTKKLRKVLKFFS